MTKRYLRALWAALLHVIVLMAAHGIAGYATDVSREVAALVRDEGIVDAADGVLALLGR
jgi:hypothetical protein